MIIFRVTMTPVRGSNHQKRDHLCINFRTHSLCWTVLSWRSARICKGRRTNRGTCGRSWPCVVRYSLKTKWIKKSKSSWLSTNSVANICKWNNKAFSFPWQTGNVKNPKFWKKKQKKTFFLKNQGFISGFFKLRVFSKDD